MMTTQRMWRHAELSRENFHKVSPKLRGVLQSYMDGLRHFMKEHPEQVPPWAKELHPWDSVDLDRYIILGMAPGRSRGRATARGDGSDAGVWSTSPYNLQVCGCLELVGQARLKVWRWAKADESARVGDPAEVVSLVRSASPE